MPQMTVDAMFSSRTSAASLVGVALTFWLPYLTFATGTPLVNPFWATVFGVTPALIRALGLPSLAFFAALAWPLVIVGLVGVLLLARAKNVSRAAHILLWCSLGVVLPTAAADNMEIYRSLTVYRFLSM